MSTGQDPSTAPVDAPLGERLQGWLETDEPKTIRGLLDHFGPQAFAMSFVLLAAPSALPIPTGGLTDVLNVIAMLIAVQLVIGRERPWLPERFAGRELKSLRSDKTRSRLLGAINRVQKVARPRFARTLESPPGRITFGLIVIVLLLAAVVAPPFSGLDTLPALGVVVVSLGMLFGDALIVGVGAAIGAGGIGLMIALAGAITATFGKVF
ncbi:exopolysaccharide biosynthesis protein [Sporichthya sp.]|uniref:exopolysaccharide biosynthesis protein n=1 Tax=Sporichthya sp. TaxID=65475 RepID=UPI0017C77464|nr:exopolysaccharide biosynthesis protein [Sporichthya sp.]MBA3742466.1 exopolysaccharide biosynthesis protein [Sporichthya sp.]